MFCQSCGTELTAGLRYCKRCGANVGAADESVTTPSGPPRLTLIVLILALMTFACLTGLLMFAGAEAHDIAGTAIVFIVLAGIVLIFGVDALIVRFLSAMYGNSIPVHRPKSARKELISSPVSVPALEPGPPSIASVTEHTTRSFDPSKQGLTR